MSSVKPKSVFDLIWIKFNRFIFVFEVELLAASSLKKGHCTKSNFQSHGIYAVVTR